nr:hypothetical protein NNDYNQYS_NNDYNQYS_CDS_0011 [Microvirus sp.]CAI9752257.1 hypothetical protein HGHZXEWH_HGHZXEWH_CDS_0011 [Microvirus sp.]
MDNFLKAAISGIGGVPLLATIGSGADLIGSIWSKERANKMNKEINEENLDFQKEQFQYQKYLNNNQFQIQSADAQKAGINPLAMTAGSLNGGSYSNSSNSMESVYNGELGSLITQFANIANQKQISDDKNETEEKIADLNASNSKDIAILKILSDENIAKNLNENQMNMLLAKLSSEEGIASDKLAENKRHNKAIEEIQDKLAESQKVLNSGTVNHYIAMDALNSVNSAIDNLLKQSNDKRLNSYLENDKKKLEQDIKNGQVQNGTKIANSIIDTIKLILPFLGLL